MSWKYSQAADIRSAQAALSNSLRATARASKMASRGRVGYGQSGGGNFGNLGMGQFKGNERGYLARIPYGQQARRVVPMVYPGETKYFDCGINAAVTWAGTDWSASEVPCTNYINSSGTAAAYTDSCLLPTAIGSGYGQVNGNRYRLKKIRVRGQLAPGVASDQADVPGTVTVRALLVMDTMPNGAQAQGEDVMQDVGDYSSNAYTFQRVSNTGGRFRILKDKWFRNNPAVAVNNAGATTVSEAYTNSIFKFQWVPKVPVEVNIKAGNATPTVAGLSNLNIFLLAYSYNQGAGGAQTVNVNAACRTYYFD